MSGFSARGGIPQIAFMVNGAADVSSASSSPVKIPFASAPVNAGSGYSTSNKKFVAPVKGMYQMNLSAVVGAVTGGQKITLAVASILVNGGDPYYSGPQAINSNLSADYVYVSCSAAVSLDVNDTVEFFVMAETTSGNFLSQDPIGDGSYASGFLIAPT